MNIKSLLLFTGCISLAGCATRSPLSLPEVEPHVAVQEIIEADQEMTTQESSEQTALSSHPRIPVEINESVVNWIQFFTGRSRARFSRYLARGNNYQESITEILKSYDIPTELYYLAMIESGFARHARSRYRAVGIWQFIRPTAKRYGLRVNHRVDDRKDPVRSTHAAAQYLKDLYERFGSWYLAMAAYNAGEGRIAGAIRRGKTKDFWTLVEKKALPKETMHYVPKFLAALIIGRNPEGFGFGDEPKIEILPPPRVAASVRPKAPKFHRVKRGENLHVIAKKYRIPVRRLKKINRLGSSMIYAGQNLRLRRGNI